MSRNSALETRILWNLRGSRSCEFHLFRKACLGGSLGVADSYADGDWNTPDLVAVFRFFLAKFTSNGWYRRWLGHHPEQVGPVVLPTQSEKHHSRKP